MNIYFHELKAYTKSTIMWICGIAAVAILFFLMYPVFADNAADMQQMLQGFPEAVQKALGLTPDNITSLLGFYGFVIPFVLLCGAIQAMNFGTSIISKEMRQKTADFLLTKPVTRTKIMTSKLLAILTMIVVTNILYMPISIIMASAVKIEAFDMKIFLLISLSLFFVQLIFLALGVVVSVIARKIKSVISISLGTVFVFFILSMFGSAIDDEKIRYITPFKYFDADYIIKHGAYETTLMIIGAVFIIAAITVSYIIYRKKDIHAV